MREHAPGPKTKTKNRVNSLEVIASEIGTVTEKQRVETCRQGGRLEDDWPVRHRKMVAQKYD